MILGIGMDSVETIRFAHWHRYSVHQLTSLFSPEEIRWCLQHTVKSAERFAVRFAVKEAFFKALSVMTPTHGHSLRSLCKKVRLTSLASVPHLEVDWNAILPPHTLSLKTHVSLTHTARTASAVVIIEQLLP